MIVMGKKEGEIVHSFLIGAIAVCFQTGLKVTVQIWLDNGHVFCI